MANYRDILNSLAWRSAIAVVVIAAGGWIIGKGMKLEGFAAAPYLIFGMAAFVAAAIIMGLPLARLVAEFLGNLIFTSEHYKTPQPVYGIPAAKRKKGLIEEAFEDLQQISREHPQEVKAYMEMIDIALVDMKNPDLASSTFHCGMDAMEEEKDREMLSEWYREISSRTR